jgi:hypothetical protein
MARPRDCVSRAVTIRGRDFVFDADFTDYLDLALKNLRSSAGNLRNLRQQNTGVGSAQYGSLDPTVDDGLASFDALCAAKSAANNRFDRPLHNSFGHENAIPFVIPAKAGMTKREVVQRSF